MQKIFPNFLVGDNLTQCLEYTVETPVTQSLTDQDIINRLNKNLNSITESEEEKIKITPEGGLSYRL